MTFQTGCRLGRPSQTPLCATLQVGYAVLDSMCASVTLCSLLHPKAAAALANAAVELESAKARSNQRLTQVSRRQ